MGSRKVQPSDLEPGDHLKVRRYGALYAHHGIYIGDGKVIHFTDAAGLAAKARAVIVETAIEVFLCGGDLRRVEHRRRLPPGEAIDRARNWLERADYSLVWNNCEHFAHWCVTGRKTSTQVRRAVATVAALAGVIFMGRIGRAAGARRVRGRGGSAPDGSL